MRGVPVSKLFAHVANTCEHGTKSCESDPEETLLYSKVKFTNFLMPLAKRNSLSSRAGLSKKGIARTLRGHFFELFGCTTSGIKEIQFFLPDFRALRDKFPRFHAKEGTWTSQKPLPKFHYELNPLDSEMVWG